MSDNNRHSDASSSQPEEASGVSAANVNEDWWTKNTRRARVSARQVKTYGAGVISATMLVGALVFGLVSWALVGTDMSQQKTSQFDSVEHLVSVDAVLAQCGNIFTFTPQERYYGVFDPEDLAKKDGSYKVPRTPMIVPAYGYMVDEYLDGNKVFYEPDERFDREKMMRSLYGKYTFIWYDDKVSESDLESIRNYVEQRAVAGDRIVVAAPWQEGRAMPMGRHIAFSSWNVTQSCLRWDPAIADEYLAFVDTHPEYAPYNYLQPPAAQLTDEGTLPPIRPRR